MAFRCWKRSTVINRIIYSSRMNAEKRGFPQIIFVIIFIGRHLRPSASSAINVCRPQDFKPLHSATRQAEENASVPPLAAR